MDKLILQIIFVTLACIGFTSCAAREKITQTNVVYYQPAYRQTPPEPVYSRVTWSHLPQPIRTKVRDTAPYYLPVITFDLPRSNLDEAIEAVAQTMGYRWHYPQEVARRRIALKMVGSVEDVLAEIGKQANVKAVLDHDQRIVRVVDGAMVPSLPNKK